MKPIFTLLLVVMMAASLTPAYAEEVEVGGQRIFRLPFGSVQSAAIWPTKQISVCWENPSLSDARYRLIVRQAVADTWERYSQLTFVGWAKCENTQDKKPARGIHIQISDVNPGVIALGQYLDAAPNGMTLDFTFQNWSPSCQQNVDFCVYVIAVHEFGHAIGFAHEQNRADAPKACQEQRQGTPGDWNVTKYDPYSVMNYCNLQWNGDGNLSARDIEAVQTIYTKR
jgi:hypothetical protein